LRPCDAASAEQRETAEANLDRALLQAMMDNPDGTQAEWGATIGRAKGSINKMLQRLRKLKFVDEALGKWHVTPKGMEALA
jgi:DNA-binding IclR family transcriptional regulator